MRGYQSVLSALGVPLVWFLLGIDTSPGRSFGCTRANPYPTQSASDRESVGDSNRGSSVGPVRVSLHAAARLEKTVGGCTIYEPWRCMPIQHRVTTSTSPCPALNHHSLLCYPLASSQSTCIYPACSFPTRTRTYTMLYGISHVHESIIFSFHSASVTLSLSCISSRVDMHIHPSRPLLSVH